MICKGQSEVAEPWPLASHPVGWPWTLRKDANPLRAGWRPMEERDGNGVQGVEAA